MVPLVRFVHAQCRCARRSPGRSFNVRASYDDEAEALVTHFMDKGGKVGSRCSIRTTFWCLPVLSHRKGAQEAQHGVLAKGTFQRTRLPQGRPGRRCWKPARRSRAWWARTRRRRVHQGSTHRRIEVADRDGFVRRHRQPWWRSRQGWRRRCHLTSGPFPKTTTCRSSVSAAIRCRNTRVKNSGFVNFRRLHHRARDVDRAPASRKTADAPGAVDRSTDQGC